MDDPIARPPSDYERALCEALLKILGQGKHALGDIVAGLNEAGMRTESGEAWTEENFVSTMRALGDGPETSAIATSFAQATVEALDG